MMKDFRDKNNQYVWSFSAKGWLASTVRKCYGGGIRLRQRLKKIVTSGVEGTATPIDMFSNKCLAICLVVTAHFVVVIQGGEESGEGV